MFLDCIDSLQQRKLTVYLTNRFVLYNKELNFVMVMSIVCLSSYRSLKARTNQNGRNSLGFYIIAHIHELDHI